MALPERQCITEISLEGMREIKIRARPFQARLSIVEVRIKTLHAGRSVSAVVGKNFAECVAGLEIQTAAKTPANFHAGRKVS